jgi:hypothetical protein
MEQPMEFDYENVKISMKISDLMKIEALIDSAIQVIIEEKGYVGPHNNQEIADLMALYHRVIPEALKPAI